MTSTEVCSFQNSAFDNEAEDSDWDELPDLGVGFSFPVKKTSKEPLLRHDTTQLSVPSAQQRDELHIQKLGSSAFKRHQSETQVRENNFSCFDFLEGEDDVSSDRHERNCVGHSGASQIEKCVTLFSEEPSSSSSSEKVVSPIENLQPSAKPLEDHQTNLECRQRDGVESNTSSVVNMKFSFLVRFQ